MMDYSQTILVRKNSLVGRQGFGRPGVSQTRKERSGGTNPSLKGSVTSTSLVSRPFQSALVAGHDAERRWVDAIRVQGRSVAHGRKLVVAQHNKALDHVESPDAVGLFSVEIKERSLSFTCPADYPFDTVFVDDLRGLGRETVCHLAYVYLSKPTGKWVWLTPLDRDATWTETVVFDRGRGHEVPTLQAPKAHLRPAETLIQMLYPHRLLELVDGDTGLFLSGGGEVVEADRYVAPPRSGTGGRE